MQDESSIRKFSLDAPGTSDSEPLRKVIRKRSIDLASDNGELNIKVIKNTPVKGDSKITRIFEVQMKQTSSLDPNNMLTSQTSLLKSPGREEFGSAHKLRLYQMNSQHKSNYKDY